MTIKDLSAQTGYSVGTISRVLNNQPNVSERARRAVMAAAEASGFQLNVNAKQLKQQHATSILVVVKGTSNELFATLMEAIQSLAVKLPYPLLVEYIDEDDNEVLRAVQLCREKKPLGVLFLGGNQENFRKDFHRITQPCVLVTNDASGLSFSNLSSVTTDDRQAACRAVEHLVRLGPRHSVVVGGDRAVSDTSRLRYQGCMDAFRSHEISFDERLDYWAGRYSYADGYRAVQDLLARGRQFTGLFAMADVIAIGAVRALRDNGLRVPEDVSVMGFDGLPIGEYFIPKLATISQPVEALAARSFQILRECIEDKGEARYETVPFTVAWKESVQILNCEE